MSFDKILHSEKLKDLGIVDWGYTEEAKPRSYENFQDWVSKGHHGPLKYLEGERGQKRSDITNYFPGFQSAIVFLFSYADQKARLEKFYNENPHYNGLKVASYALGFDGEDYHYTLRDRLETLKKEFKKELPGLEVGHSLDIQPVLERDLAYRAGLGWFGKNSMFISRRHGSFCMIGALYFNKPLDIEIKEESSDHCGNCTACIEACPTDAIEAETRTIIGPKCITTFTIEQFKDISPPPEGYTKSQGEIFGCDICQDVCPWNKRPINSYMKEVTSLDETASLDLKLVLDFFLKRPLKTIADNLENLSNKKFQKVFKSTALKRTGRVGLLKNIKPFLKDRS